MTTTQAIIMTLTPVLFVAIGLALIYWPARQKSESKETNENDQI